MRQRVLQPGSDLYALLYAQMSLVGDRDMPLAVKRSTSTVGLPRESKIYCYGKGRSRHGGRGETFLTGVDFGDGHGGVAERKVGWCRWRASLAIYAQPKWFSTLSR